MKINCRNLFRKKTFLTNLKKKKSWPVFRNQYSILLHLENMNKTNFEKKILNTLRAHIIVEK